MYNVFVKNIRRGAMTENRYDFKIRNLVVHKKDQRDLSLFPSDGEYEIKNGTAIVLPEAESVVVRVAAFDLAECLLVSMGVGAYVTKETAIGSPKIILSFNKDIGEGSGYMGYRITVSECGIDLEGYDERGIAQGIYYLEDLMKRRRAPFLKLGVVARRAMFSRRVTQSPVGFAEYPEGAMSVIAHSGFDSIEIWVESSFRTARGAIDLPVICSVAEKYGIDVYIKMFAPHEIGEKAEAFYDKLYGGLFSHCPKIAGIAIVGEAAQFGSRDPHVGLAPASENYIENIPTGKPTPGWWPCEDLPDTLRLIQNAVYKYKPDAKIILSTYNWGYAPEEFRIKLIENLPKGISIRSSWDVFEKIKTENVVEMTRDYTLSFVGPSETFKSEAKAAKACGVPLGANTNCAGMTWDFGTIPYEPMPYQWIKRFCAVLSAREEYGLSEFIENIEYGFNPSFISELAREAFFTEVKPLPDVLSDIIKAHFGEDSFESVDRALRYFSEAVQYHVPTNEEQYGAFRIGPAYPLWSMHDLKNEGKIPSVEATLYGNAVYNGTYHANYARACALPGMRMPVEIRRLEKMRDILLLGVKELLKIENPGDEIIRLRALGEFMYRTTITGINVKRHFVLLKKLDVEETYDGSKKLLSELRKLLLEERENVLSTIPVVRVNSSLGYSAGMDYQGDEKCLKWKLRQLDHELNVSLPLYEEKLEYGE